METSFHVKLSSASADCYDLRLGHVTSTVLGLATVGESVQRGNVDVRFP